MNNHLEMNNILPNETPRGWNLIFIMWLIATCGTLTSLFFSEIMQLPVCVLCWYQRIALYPLVLIIPMGLFPYDTKIIRYAVPLVLVGWCFALFHVLVVAGFIPESIQPCVQGIPCSEINFSLFGFLNIPIMSIITFTFIGILLYLANKTINKANYKKN